MRTLWPRTSRITLGFILISVCLGPAALAEEAANGEERKWSVALDATYNSKYVWRGINVVDGSVFQPSASWSHEGLTVSLWANLDATDENDNDGEFTEVDYALDYSGSWREWNFSLGALYYRFPNSEDDPTTEFYGAVGADVLLAPTLTLYQDVDEVEGTYVSLAVGHDFEDVWEVAGEVRVSVELSLSLGYGSREYNEAYYGEDDGAFTDVLLSVAFPVQVGERWTFTPSISYSALLDEDIRRNMDEDDNAWIGASLSWGF